MNDLPAQGGHLTRRGLIAGSLAAAAAVGMARTRVARADDAVKITWSSWGNTGEVALLKAYNDSFNKANPTIQATYNPVPTDGYDAKLLTQINGGQAPDVFYANDSTTAIMSKNAKIVDLTQLLAGPDSKSPVDQFAGDLWGASETTDGHYYGVTTDCNPYVIWYNIDVLQKAGITQMPADLYEAGGWNWQAFQSMLDQVAKSGKKGAVYDEGAALRDTWVSINGGKMYDGGKFVANQDPKAVAAFQFIYDNIRGDKIIFGGSLPQGQGSDALFLSGQLAFAQMGRWGLPLFKQNKELKFDIVPFPTNTGQKLEPAAVATAYLVLNAASPHQKEAFTFLTDFVSPAGQQERLGPGGNAVPSIKGAENVILSDTTVPHTQYFLDARSVGFATDREESATAGLGDKIGSMLSPLWLKGGDVQQTLDSIAEMANKAIAAGTVS